MAAGPQDQDPLGDCCYYSTLVYLAAAVPGEAVPELGDPVCEALPLCGKLQEPGMRDRVQ